MFRKSYRLGILVLGLLFSFPVFSREPLCGIEQAKSKHVDSIELDFRNSYCNKPSSRMCNEKWSNGKLFLAKALTDSRISDVGTISYMFGTIYAETENKNFSPSTAEIIGKHNRNKEYVKDGFYGRGWIQLTYKDKYELAKAKLSQDFVKNPDLVGTPDNAYEILYRGMTEGWIEVYRTSINGAADNTHLIPVKLGDFVTSEKVDYDLARAVINANCKKNKSKECVPPNIEYRPGLFIPPSESLDAGNKAANAATKMEKILCK